MSFKDHFSGHAGAYRDGRPRYDPALFAWLAAQTAGHDLAWDAGCGNGQASTAVAEHYARVVGTDPSAPQIANAQAHPHVEYRVEPAEQCSLPDRCADLVTVAQAMHWFDLDRFYPQVHRVLRPGGLFAAWAYADCRVDADVDAVKNVLYVDVLDSYWAPERRLVEQGYATLPFPFAPVPAPPFELRVEWYLAQFLAYLRSWSATQKYLREHGVDPVAPLEADFARAWGDPQTVRAVVWDLYVKAGRVE